MMTSFIRRHLSYANVVATMALVFAMGGSAVAARHYLLNSTNQIKPSLLKKLKGNAGAKGATGPAGLQGLQGLQGKEGLQGREGPPGPVKLSAIKEVTGPTNEAAPGKAAASEAKCPKGSRAISGGQIVESEKIAPNFDDSFAASGRTAWLVEVGNPAGTAENIAVTAIAYCAGEGEAVAG